MCICAALSVLIECEHLAISMQRFLDERWGSVLVRVCVCVHSARQGKYNFACVCEQIACIRVCAWTCTFTNARMCFWWCLVCAWSVWLCAWLKGSVLLVVKETMRKSWRISHPHGAISVPSHKPRQHESPHWALWPLLTKNKKRRKNDITFSSQTK